jgi:hypothetical protein
MGARLGSCAGQMFAGRGRAKGSFRGVHGAAMVRGVVCAGAAGVATMAGLDGIVHRFGEFRGLAFAVRHWRLAPESCSGAGHRATGAVWAGGMNMHVPRHCRAQGLTASDTPSH